MWWNFPSVEQKKNISTFCEPHFGLNSRSSEVNKTKDCVCHSDKSCFVIRSNKLTFSSCQVLSGWLSVLCVCLRVCESATHPVCFLGGTAVEKLPSPTTISAHWEWSACTYFCLFDQSHKSTVVVYTLVLTRCADHILYACGPTFFFHPPHTFRAPSSKPQEQKPCFFVTHHISCFFFFFSFTVPLVKAVLKAGWDALLLF